MQHGVGLTELMGTPDDLKLVSSLTLFGTIDGYLCEDCALEVQKPFNAELRHAIELRAPQITAADLSRLPDQMLKFTLMLPIPHQH